MNTVLGHSHAVEGQAPQPRRAAVLSQGSRAAVALSWCCFPDIRSLWKACFQRLTLTMAARCRPTLCGSAPAQRGQRWRWVVRASRRTAGTPARWPRWPRWPMPPTVPALATGGADGVRSWDARTGQQLQQLTGHTNWVLSVAYAPDGATLASGGADGVRIWDARTGQQLQQLTGHTGRVLSVAYPPDGATLASGGADGTVRIWDARTGQQLQQLTGHTAEVRSGAYPPDGATLATGGDTTIRIWNPRNGTQIDGTGFGTPRRIGRPLAGVRSDAPSAEDLIGATSDVETLADLIAATATSPPLAIALIGDWGAGKSSVMLQIQRRIDVLAEMSRNNPGLSAFAANVRQVRFNAWDYSDRQLWSGLADHLFTALAADPDSTPSLPDPATARTERDALRTKLAGLEAEEQRLSRELSTADQAHRPQGFLAWLGSPAYTWRIMAAAARELALDIRGALGILLGWAVLGTAAY